MDKEVLLAALRSAETGQEKWDILSPGVAEADPDIQAAVAWWRARYDYTDRRKKQTRDKYIWLLVSLAACGRGQFSGGKPIREAYQLGFTGEAFEAAMAQHPNGLYEQFLEAAAFFAETYREEPRLLGLVALGKSTKEQTLNRVSRQMVTDILWPFYKACSQLAHNETIFKAIWDGTVQQYPAIPAYLWNYISEKEEGLAHYIRGIVWQQNS